ncbi:uncharacterized protein PGTG_10669 [Puccinia graminis f. sp. tritici CRL 75-36-700-3]|uniref:Uncharacterized protein n=1 Tax=Puccinia graminis f. sp. tritici (strain CRL 75-36-700-3 / race SCCL) TaxID=418459 RepID=E3KJ16_PUCGT|nr:uncharacterized protein PGTG_10669 [Puccinia graminis f. sp. tritici CRL 75-36-700-3]EFP84291.2 hypothetical protein PGTG_10669 [Puccinia graminis f. sp. tritici CRL 75-36-700-3]
MDNFAQSNIEVPTKDDAAQLMLELKSAQQKHKSSGLSPKSIYGILCSTETWEFWSCDIHGTCRRTGTLPTTRRDVAISLKNLRYLFEITYHTFFEAYVVALEALTTRRRLQVTPEQQVKLRKWQSSLDLATIAFNMAKAAKDKAGFDDAVEQLRESFDLLPEDHKRHQSQLPVISDLPLPLCLEFDCKCVDEEEDDDFFLEINCWSEGTKVIAIANPINLISFCLGCLSKNLAVIAQQQLVSMFEDNLHAACNQHSKLSFTFNLLESNRTGYPDHFKGLLCELPQDLCNEVIALNWQDGGVQFQLQFVDILMRMRAEDSQMREGGSSSFDESRV